MRKDTQNRKHSEDHVQIARRPQHALQIKHYIYTKEWDLYTPKQICNRRRSKDDVYLAGKTVYIQNERFESDLYTRKENSMNRTCCTDNVASNGICTIKERKLYFGSIHEKQMTRTCSTDHVARQTVYLQKRMYTYIYGGEGE